MALGTVSYAQVAEDLLAAYYLKKDKNISYIDVGCLWPVSHSSTYYFYERGGSGICVDPNPSVAESFASQRPNDIFVNCGIAETSSELDYFAFENPVFNTFSKARAHELSRDLRRGRTLLQTIKIPVRPLTDILVENSWRERHGNMFDFLSIDVEGFELDVVRSLDMSYSRPNVIALEMAVKSERARFEQAVAHLTGNQYVVAGQTGHDIFLVYRG